jgi:predicted DNA-binding protein
MPQKMDKARKMIALWAEDANRLKRLSDHTGRTQVELIHEAIVELERILNSEEETPHAR